MATEMDNVNFLHINKNHPVCQYWICPLCKEFFNDPVATNCKPKQHLFCRGCIEGRLRTDPACPICEQKVYVEDLSHNCSACILDLLEQLLGPYTFNLLKPCLNDFLTGYGECYDQNKKKDKLIDELRGTKQPTNTHVRRLNRTLGPIKAEHSFNTRKNHEQTDGTEPGKIDVSAKYKTSILQLLMIIAFFHYEKQIQTDTLIEERIELNEKLNEQSIQITGLQKNLNEQIIQITDLQAKCQILNVQSEEQTILLSEKDFNINDLQEKYKYLIAQNNDKNELLSQKEIQIIGLHDKFDEIKAEIAAIRSNPMELLQNAFHRYPGNNATLHGLAIPPPSGYLPFGYFPEGYHSSLAADLYYRNPNPNSPANSSNPVASNRLNPSTNVPVHINVTNIAGGTSTNFGGTNTNIAGDRYATNVGGSNNVCGGNSNCIAGGNNGTGGNNNCIASGNNINTANDTRNHIRASNTNPGVNDNYISNGHNNDDRNNACNHINTAVGNHSAIRDRNTNPNGSNNNNPQGPNNIPNINNTSVNNNIGAGDVNNNAGAGGGNNNIAGGNDNNIAGGNNNTRGDNNNIAGGNNNLIDNNNTHNNVNNHVNHYEVERENNQAGIYPDDDLHSNATTDLGIRENPDEVHPPIEDRFANY